MAAATAPKSRRGLYLGIGGGCGCLGLLACIISAFVFFSSIGPGEEVASRAVPLNQPFVLTYQQDADQDYRAWLEVEVNYTSGYNLGGQILLSENNTAFGQYTLAETGTGSPIQERNSSTRVNWVTSNLNGNGSASGKVALFPIPDRTAGSTISLTGTITANPGTTGTVRLIVAER